MEEKVISEKEGMELISTMINKAKNSHHDTGISSIMWGAVIAFCSLEKFAEIRFGYSLPFDIFLLTLVAIVPQVFIAIREKKMRRVKSFDDVYMDYIWLGFGIGLGMLIFVINVMGNQWEAMASTYLKATGNKSSFQLYEFVTPLLLIIYGIPTFTTGAACRFTPMLWGGILCWVCCAVAAFTRADIDMLLMAFSAVFAWLIPGILMEKDYRIAKKELEKSNV